MFEEDHDHLKMILSYLPHIERQLWGKISFSDDSISHFYCITTAIWHREYIATSIWYFANN